MPDTTGTAGGAQGTSILPRVAPASGAASRKDKAAKPATRMAKLARLASARGYVWTAFYNLYAAAVADGDADAGYQLADVLASLHPTHARVEIDEAFELALRKPWARPASLTRAIVDYLMLDWRVECALNGAPLSGEDLGAMAERLANRELFAALLQGSAVADLRLERLLVVLRDYLAGTAPLTASETRLAALVATQANLVEYLWARPADAGAPAGDRSGAAASGAGERALRASLFRPPDAEEIGALESLERSAAVAFLLVRVRDEPVRHARLCEQIARQATGFALDELHETGCCPRWVTQPVAPRNLPLAVHRRLRRQQHAGSEILVVGCGTGQDLFSLCATYPQAHVTALDSSPQALAYAALRCEDQRLQGIDFLPGSLLDVAPLGWVFDVIECLDPRRQFPDLDFGCEALARCTTRGSLVRVAVPAESTDRLVSALRASARASGIGNDAAGLKRFRQDLLEGRHGALPPVLLEAPDFYTLSGLRNLLFAGTDSVPAAPAWLAMLDAHGFDFLCEEAGSQRAREASLEKLPATPACAIRDSRRDPSAAFLQTQFLWFERRAARRR